MNLAAVNQKLNPKPGGFRVENPGNSVGKWETHRNLDAQIHRQLGRPAMMGYRGLAARISCLGRPPR